MPKQEKAMASSGRKKTEAGEKYIHFDCRFTERIRSLFKRKRLELGLPYVKLGELFGVNWSTVRKWEVGPTCSCELHYRRLIEEFLNGEFDFHFRSSEMFDAYSGNISPQMYQCMERVLSTYLLCKGNQEVTQALLSQLDDVSNGVIKSMVKP